MQELEGVLHDEDGRTDLGIAFMHRLITDPTLLNANLLSNPVAGPVEPRGLMIVWGFLGKWEQLNKAAIAI